MHSATREARRDDTMRGPGDALARRRVCVPVYEVDPVEAWVKEVVGEVGMGVAVLCEDECGFRGVVCWVGQDAAAG
jgi:hypothetical protein